MLLPDIAVGSKSVLIFINLGEFCTESLEDIHIVVMADHVIVFVGNNSQHLSLNLPPLDVLRVLLHYLSQPFN